MAATIRVRNVPDNVYAILKSRAVQEGISLSDFIKRELERLAARPTTLEWLESTRRLKPVVVGNTAAQVIREMRSE
jgi:hypothetical protein